MTDESWTHSARTGVLASNVSIGGLINQVGDNIRRAREEAHSGEYRELLEYESSYSQWARRYTAENDRQFWLDTRDRTRSLIARIMAREDSGLEVEFEERDVPQARIAAHESWADYSSTSEEEETNYLYTHVQGVSHTSGLVIPGDLKTVWPRGYRVFYEASQAFGLDLVEDPLTLGRSGFKGGDALSDDPNIAKAAFALLNEEEQRSLNILKSLVMFLKLKPDETLAADPKFALSANYVLHFLLKNGDAEHDSAIAKSLKHEDGGRKIIIHKIGQLFSADRTLTTTLMNTIDRVCKFLSRSAKSRPGGIGKELHKLIVESCFTSPEGMLEKYYVKERREVTKLVEELDGRGRSKLVKKKRVVNGFRAPGLLLGDEQLKPEERSRLKGFEHVFNMPKLARNAVSTFRERGGDIDEVTTSVRTLVEDAYSVTALISTVMKQRKREIRALALASAGKEKLTQAVWLASARTVLQQAEDLPETTYERISDFLQKWGA